MPEKGIWPSPDDRILDTGSVPFKGLEPFSGNVLPFRDEPKMYARIFLITAAAATLALTGCRNDAFVNAQVDTMRAEYLALENDYFALEDEYLAQRAELEACRGGKKTKSGETSSDGTPSGDDSSSDSDSEGFAPPNIEFGTPGAPEIEFGTPVDPSELQPDDPQSERASPSEGAGFAEPIDPEVILPAVEEINYVEPTDKHVTHIVVNPYLTTGHDFDSKPGDDGIALLVEPRNGDDQLVPVAGKISIVVLDPALEGDAARVARWDFSTEEAARRVKTGDDRNPGLSFKLPWPGASPEHSKLHVFVRMESDEGKTLEDDSEFYVILPGQFSQRWTPISHPSRPDRELGIRAEDEGYAVVPANHVGEGADQESNSLAHAVAIVKEEPAPAGGKPNSRNSQTVSSTQSKRPVWKPYR